MKKPKKKSFKIAVTKNGPYIVTGGLPLAKEIIVTDRDGNPLKYAKGDKYPSQKSYALCRCGRSENMPYCDSAHGKIRFDGKETAGRKKYSEQAMKIPGPELILNDARELCATARFCHRAGGTWRLVRNSDDPKSKQIATEEACNCPGGRLTVCDKKTGMPIEPPFKPSISLVEDPEKKVSGPVWAKGGIPVESSDGTLYETRNRVALCRCGKSRNKPFCDGSHIRARFNDGDKSLRR